MLSAPQVVHPLTGKPLPAFDVRATGQRAPVDARSRVATATGAKTLKVPSPATAGSVFVVEDVDLQAAANPITLDGDGATIDGAATQELATNGIVASLLFDGTEWTRTLVKRRVVDEVSSLGYVKTLELP